LFDLLICPAFCDRKPGVTPPKESRGLAGWTFHLFTLLSSKRKSSAFIVDGESKTGVAGESALEMPFEILAKSDAASGFKKVRFST
jgi:hypothetical protein